MAAVIFSFPNYDHVINMKRREKMTTIIALLGAAIMLSATLTSSLSVHWSKNVKDRIFSKHKSCTSSDWFRERRLPKRLGRECKS